MSLSTAALSRRNPASAGTSRDTYNVQGRDKRSAYSHFMVKATVLLRRTFGFVYSENRNVQETW